MKRDTIGDLGDSLADGLGLNSNGPMEDLDIDVSIIVPCMKSNMLYASLYLQKSTYCIQDEACLRPIKWCNKEKYIVYGHCEFAVRSTR